jgi:1,4-alpha-glucan branching enzyme
VTVAQTHIGPDTPLGATVLADGVTFRVWAPKALAVYVVIEPKADYLPSPEDELVQEPGTGHWAGFVPGVAEGSSYLFYVVGSGGRGLKRDPWAREIGGSYPTFVCIVRDETRYPWHDAGFRPPGFADLIVYQFHVGVFSAVDDQGHDLRAGRVSKLLDALERAPYLARLGINAVQPLPVVEFRTPWSQGYNGTDLFSPEMDYCVQPVDLGPYLDQVNTLLAAKDCPPLTTQQLTGHVNQLKAFVDVFHLYGVAVIADVVYNHAGDGSGSLDPESLDWFDLPATHGPDDNPYFGTGNWIGPIFKFPDPNVQHFLTSNALMFLTDYHADGLRFDEVRVIKWNGGERFCQDLTDTLRWVKPDALLLAEYWDEPREAALRRPPAGLGFDAEYGDRLRDGVRAAVSQSAGGSQADVDINRLAASLQQPPGVPAAWQTYNYLENHDLELDQDGDSHRSARIARLSDALDSRSWYARSRSRVATGLLLTAPGIPALFMGQEFLEDKLWSDSPDRSDLFIWWDGAEGADPVMVDFLRCTRDLLTARRQLPGLRSQALNVFHTNPADRILAFHRWVPDQGQDVVVVASLRESPFAFGSYQLGFPLPGQWTERLNTDAYEPPGSAVQGNAGHVIAGGPPLHGLPYSAGLTIPANGLLIFTH